MDSSNTTEIDIKLIRGVKRLRVVDEAEVKKIAISMGEIGQITPVEVRRNPEIDGEYILIAGAHRMAAALELGWQTVGASIFEGTDDQARLREIDENLCRHELNPFDQANFLAERREIWERVHGEVKRGGDRRSKGRGVPLLEAIAAQGFFKNTAEKFGLHEKMIKRALTRKAQIIQELWKRLQGTDAARNGALLDKIRSLTTEDQAEILELLNERGCTAGEAVRQVTKLPPVDREVRQLDALRRAWERAEGPARKAFLQSIQAKASKA